MSTHALTVTQSPGPLAYHPHEAPRYWIDLAYRPSTRPFYPFARPSGEVVAPPPRPTDAECRELSQRERERAAWWEYQLALYYAKNDHVDGANNGGHGGGQDGDKGRQEDEPRAGGDKEVQETTATPSNAKAGARQPWDVIASFFPDAVRLLTGVASWNLWAAFESLQRVAWWTAILALVSTGLVCLVDGVIQASYAMYERTTYRPQYVAVPCLRCWTGANGEWRLFYNSCR